MVRIADKEWVFADGTILHPHLHSTGTTTERSEAISKSRVGKSTTIHLVVDSFGLPIYVELSEGLRHDVASAESLVKHIGNFEYFIADEGFDSKALRALIVSLKSQDINSP